VVTIHGGNVIQLVGDSHLAGPGAGRDHWHPDTPRLLAEAGFNGVRLSIFMDRVAPAPGKIDLEYLAAVAATVSAYKGFGVLTLLDFHQDEFSAAVGVRGLPSWMTLTDGHSRDPSLQFPNGYFRDPAVQVAFDNFWKDKLVTPGTGLQEAYLAAVAAVARRFANEPAVFGLDLMNEPATGTPCNQPDPRSADCPQLERELLGPFYRKAGNTLAEAAPRTILFVEPFMLQGALGIPIHTPMPGSALQGLSFHNYGPFRATRDAVSQAALACASEHHAAIINTEWGFSNDASDLAAQAQDFDNRLIPWLAWARGPFEGLVNPAASSDTTLNREAVLRAYARPYAAATAGTPQSLRFDADTGVLNYRWSTTGPDGVDRSRLATEIRMPWPSFPKGYRATVVGGRITSSRNARILVVQATIGVREVTLHATRIGSLPPLTVPQAKPVVNGRLSLDSQLGDLLRDPRAKAILDKYLPTLTSSSQIGLAPQISLRAMQPYLPEMTQEVTGRIAVELADLSK
jgi:endoglycosylceramidase